MKLKKREIAGYSVLIVILLVLIYMHNNPAKVYSGMGEFFYKHNNIPVAQTYLEKAFISGVKDYKLRDLYVNTIINSPFDSEAQQKLIKFLNIPVEDNAKIKADSFLDDYRREINRNYPENYITQAVYNQKIVRWSKIPITYGFKNADGVPDYFIKEIENAMTRWEVATEHQILFTRNDSEPNIIIEFNPMNPVGENARKYVVAYTLPELNVNYLKNTTIKFYLKNPDGQYYSQNQVYNTALHELVHALGFMGHSDDDNDVMHYMKDSKAVVNDERVDLTPADINTVKLLYKIKPDITNDNNPTGTYTPFLVLGAKQKVQRAKMYEAVSYIQNAPNLAGGYIDLADGYVSNKDYEKALKCLKKALKLADSNELRAMIYYNIAVVYFYSEDYSRAERFLNAALNISESEDSRYLLAEIYSKTGQNEKAEKAYQNLIVRNPNNIEYTIGLTNLYVKERKLMKARKTLKNYVKFNPNERNSTRFKSYGIIRLFL